MAHPRLTFHSWRAAVYAIGDVHGCLSQLLDLEAQIVADGHGIEGEKWIVTLGDHLDRGPASAEVLAHIRTQAPAGFQRIALMGNHEALLLAFLDNPVEDDIWRSQGGAETLRSYGIDPAAPVGRIAADFPVADRKFIADLPLYLMLPGWLFVHAGIRPGIPLSAQTEDDLLWIRAPFLNSQMTGGLRIVHGHTPGDDVVVTPHRIGLDTGCFVSGKLSAIRVTPDGRVKFFQAVGPAGAERQSSRLRGSNRS
jgi:serine/threonine protein phosphatase 1